jgi:hypothetical protein
VHASFLGIRELYSCLRAPLLIVAFLLPAISRAIEPPRHALSQFLAGQIAPEVQEFGQIRMKREDISEWLKKLRTARLPAERGIAVANLQNCAWVLLDTPETVPVGLELLNQWVLPNATLLRSLPGTSACSWENVMMGAYASYKKAGDPHGQLRVLELISRQARDPELRDLATLRLGGIKASQGGLKEAVDIVRKSDPKGKLAEPRAKLLQNWQEQLKPKKMPQ